MNVLVIRELTFEAAHYLPGHPQCSHLHGHTYFVRKLTVVTEKFVDLLEIKSVIRQFDHSLLVPECDLAFWQRFSGGHCRIRVFGFDPAPTVEVISERLLRLLLAVDGVVDAGFELFEGPNQGCRVASSRRLRRCVFEHLHCGPLHSEREERSRSDSRSCTERQPSY